MSLVELVIRFGVNIVYISETLLMDMYELKIFVDTNRKYSKFIRNNSNYILSFLL